MHIIQEEIGLRGAKTSAWAVDPDVAIILESDIAGDVPGIKDSQAPAKLGGGPSVLIYDRSMVPNLKLRDFVTDTAEALSIPYQLSFVEAGGTDGGVVHQHKVGVPSVVLGVPARHIHSHSAISREAIAYAPFVSSPMSSVSPGASLGTAELRLRHDVAQESPSASSSPLSER